MIDIQKLKQFPLGFKSFESYIENKHGSVLFLYNNSGAVRNEDVINFLDEQNVFLCISLYPTKNNGFSFEVDCITNWYSSDDFYKTRNESTSNGIIKAFELLETKLKTN